MKRRGFTLTEILIAIVIMGILATMMMFSNNEAFLTARATKIITDLTNMRNALLVWYCDNINNVAYDSTANDKLIYKKNTYDSIQELIQKNNGAVAKEIAGYISGSGSKNTGNEQQNTSWIYLQPGGYGINDAGSGEAKRFTWFVGYQFYDNENALKRKLWGRKKSAELLFSEGIRPNMQGKLPITNASDINKAKTVWIHVIGDYVPDGNE